MKTIKVIEGQQQKYIVHMENKYQNDRLTPSWLIITLSVNSLNPPIKRQKLAE